jgi:hypothetical protein
VSSSTMIASTSVAPKDHGRSPLYSILFHVSQANNA